MNEKQKKELDIKTRTCRCCGRLMEPFFKGAYRSAIYTENGCKQIRVCSEECKNKWESQYFVEEYKEQKIYKVCDKYIPYYGAAYWFNNIEDCKRRIDDGNKIAVSPFITYC